MAVVTDRHEAGGRRAFAPGSAGFIGVLAMCMAVTALGIDAILPAYSDIRAALDLDPEATSVTALVTMYFFGSSLGLLPAGLLSDRFGRRPVMWGGLAIYAIGAVASVLAPTLTTMVVARFVWGLGSAGPRVAAMAMVRDAYEGEQMARVMSFVMAVFILVPTFAPAVAAGVLEIGPWQLIFWGCAVLGVGVAAAVARLPETLPTDQRRPLAVTDIWTSCRTVVATPGIPAYLVSLTALFGVFMSYLASSEIILDQVFGLEEWFPLFFGGIAIVMGCGMFLNGRVVERFGLRRMVALTFAANLSAVALLLSLSFATDGVPPFGAFVVVLAAVLFFQQMLVPNLNAAAMRPLAHVAGTGAAILGMVPGVAGALIGELINRQFDGSLTPLAIGFAASSTVAFSAWRIADRTARPAPLPVS